MVVGNGLMANTFSDYATNNNIIIFASGVSKSTETNKEAFDREIKLLKKTLSTYPGKVLVYFSTCSIYDESVKNRPYVTHKLEIEKLIKKTAGTYLIFRISNVVGPQGNKTTIFNFLANAIKNNREIILWKNAERNMIDCDDLKLIIDSFVTNQNYNQTINVALKESVLVSDMVKQMERFFGKKAILKIEDKGNELKIDTNEISQILDKIESKKGTGIHYVYSLLEKYYSN